MVKTIRFIVKKYMDDNNKRPSEDNNEIKKLGKWLINQNTNYNDNIAKCKKIMKNEQIYNEYKNFINDVKYQKFFSKIISQN